MACEKILSTSRFREGERKNNIIIDIYMTMDTDLYLN